MVTSQLKSNQFFRNEVNHMECKYKLRIYYKSGFQKGNLKREEFFSTKESMQQRYKELFNPREYALNPTAWEKVNEEWLRMFITLAA